MFKNKSKMKKRYIIPEIEIERIDMDLTILVQSIDINDEVGDQTGGFINDAPDLIDFGDDDVDW